MALEIERKFLVDPARWRPALDDGERLRQGYLSVEPDRVVRVRRSNDGGHLTIKGRTAGNARLEFEYAIAGEDADAMLDALCIPPLVEKVRYRERYGGRVWEIDVFEGENAGLITAEVELPEAAASVELPPWVTTEVSADPRYFNSNLIQHPYTRWSGHGSDDRG